MKKPITLILTIFILLFSVLDCKKTEEKKVDEKQVLGTRYPNGNIFIYSTPGSSKKSDQVALVYDLEEVEGLEIVTGDDNKEYMKMKTSTGKIGYGLASRFAEAVYFSIQEGVMAYKKPTLTAPTKGKMDRGAICYVKEIQGEWANSNCYSAKTEIGEKPESFYNVWIKTTEPGISKDPLIGQSALNIHKAKKKLAEGKIDPSVQKEAKELLTKVQEKEDAFSSYAGELIEKINQISSNETPPENKPQEGSESNTPSPTPEEEPSEPTP